MNKKMKIVIVGLGLMGGSYARALTKQGYQVKAIDINQRSIDYALQHQIICEGKTDHFQDFLQDVDLLILCLYPSTMLSWLAQNKDMIAKHAIVTDICGVKGCVVDKAQAILGEVEFVGAHPMAGKEVYGVENSDESIFKKANFIITPTAKNQVCTINLIKSLAMTLGFRQIKVIDVQTHDEMIAFLSQLTHVIAMSLMNCREITHLNEYTGDSFRDLVRIARINENMWSELFLLNKDNLLKEMDHFIQEMVTFRDLLENEEEDAIKAKMIASTKRKSLFDQ